MKVIIAGGRDFCIKDLLYLSIKEFENDFGRITEVVCGMAQGADTLGRLYAEFMEIQIKKFPADWDLYGKSAGPIRNREMANYADAILVFWDGKSKGTKNMIDVATEMGLKIRIVNY